MNAEFKYQCPNCKCFVSCTTEKIIERTNSKQLTLELDTTKVCYLEPMSSSLRAQFYNYLDEHQIPLNKLILERTTQKFNWRTFRFVPVSHYEEQLKEFRIHYNQFERFVFCPVCFHQYYLEINNEKIMNIEEI